MRSFIVLMMLLWTFGTTIRAQQIIRDLSHNAWTFHQKGSAQVLKAKVPGCVQTDLYRDGKIPDPYYRTDEDSLQWIGRNDWVYNTEFHVSAAILKMENVQLVFKGLDTYAQVFVNEQPVLRADNFFRHWRVNVKKYLHLGKNTLRIAFTSPVKVNRRKRQQSKIPLLQNYVYTRKPAYHFGWDWGPVYITQGIWQPVVLHAWNNARFTDFYIRQERLSDKQADLTLIFEAEADKPLSVQITATCLNIGKRLQKRFTLKKGKNILHLPLRIQNPKRWWSNGLGQPYLYRFSATLMLNGQPIDSVYRRIGLRTVKLIQKPDSLGKSFYFELNGIPVFMKGANYIPQDMFVDRPTVQTYRRTILDAKAANMNMLRVWGGGFYEKDIFYDLCDENGILVWQDFMFACAMYPGNKAFTDNVEQEIIQNVKRLRNHPCIALWCGNNESYIGWKNWGWPKHFSANDSAEIWHDYQKLFEKRIPELLRRYDPTRPYWPSSPLTNWDTLVYSRGDVHYWGVWHGQQPFEHFKMKKNIGRFVSEYGFQSCPEMSSVKKFTLPQDRNIHSKVMLTHQKHRIGYPIIDKYMKWYYKKPKDFQAYLYVSQVLQAFGIGMAIQAYRRAMPFCMGSLYWQLNDCYPVTSWSSIDYYGKWKALHYRVRELYNSLLVSPVLENGTLNVYVVSDAREPISAELVLRLFDFRGNVLKRIKKNVILQPNRSRIYFSANGEAFLNGHAKDDVLLLAEVRGQGKVLSENHFFFVYPKDLKLRKPQIVWTYRPVKGGYELTFYSDVFARQVFLSTDDGQGFFTRNFFDLIPGRPVKTFFRISHTAFDLRKKLKIYSLVDSYQNNSR